MRESMGVPAPVVHTVMSAKAVQVATNPAPSIRVKLVGFWPVTLRELDM
jgi:hypothetical protein